MTTDRFRDRYRELQSYVGWGDDDVRRIVAAAPLLEPHLPALIDDFYAEIERHPEMQPGHHRGPGADRAAQGDAARLGPRVARRTVRRRLRRSPLEGRLAARRDRARSGLHQRGPVAAPNGAEPRLARDLAGGRSPLEGDGPVAQQAARPRPGDHRGCVPGGILPRGCSRRNGSRRSDRWPAAWRTSCAIPLNVVKTSVYYLLNARNPTPEKKAEHLKRIERHVELADNVITALSRFAKMPVPNLCPIRLATCVHEVLEMNPSHGGVEVEVDFPAGLSPVLADVDQLRIVFGNLIRNAFDAMPSGGRLAIEARQADADRRGGHPRQRHRHPARKPLADHGAPLFDQGARPRPGARHRPVDPREEPGQPSRDQPGRTRQHVHGAADRLRPRPKGPHDEFGRTRDPPGRRRRGYLQ